MKPVAAVILLAMSCTRQTPSPPAAPAPATTAATAPAPVSSGPRITFPDGFVVSVEPVADAELRAQGLMYRDHLRPATGMLFFFPADGRYPFWMKNTRIPLDIIWIDAGHRIAHIKHDVPPCRVTDCPSYDPGVEARYVLEVAGGVARQHGLAVGNVLKFEGTEGIVARE